MTLGPLLRFSLITDGSSDHVLAEVVHWTLRCHLKHGSQVIGQTIPAGSLGKERDLTTRIRRAMDLYPCEILFIHRDAERESPKDRVREIRDAAATAKIGFASIVPIVPVRMTEAWLLFDESAIRRAANNPNGRAELNLPPIRDLEDVPDPKEVLYSAIRMASELNARRTEKLNISRLARRVTDFITDFSLLRRLDAFNEFEASLIGALRGLNFEQTRG